MRPLTISLIYGFAFLCGLAAVYAVASLGATRLFSGGADQQIALTVIMPVLAGVSMFSLVYGLGVGRMLKWRFWVIWPLALFACVRGGVELIMQGFLTLLEAGVILLVVIFAVGLICCLKRDRVPASEASSA